MNHFTAPTRTSFLTIRHRAWTLVPALLLLCGGGALASTPPAATTMQHSSSVSFSRAELARDSGVEAVHDRIRRAARQVCHDPGARDLRSQRRVRECREQAIADALAAINSERLNELHVMRTGGGPAAANDV